MTTLRSLRDVAGRLAAGMFAVLLVGAVMTATALGFPATTCVKSGKETVTYTVNGKMKTKSVYTGSYTDKECTTSAPAGTYRAGAEPEGKYENIKASALSEGEQDELKALLKYVQVEPSGIDAKPTLRVTGANVQIVNGAGKTESTNGEGNLVIGYDEGSKPQTGSHNLIMGLEQDVTSFGGIAGGAFNTITAPFASVLGGDDNEATANHAVVVAGLASRAKANYSLVGGGQDNEARANWSSVLGGYSEYTNEEWGVVP